MQSLKILRYSLPATYDAFQLKTEVAANPNISRVCEDVARKDEFLYLHFDGDLTTYEISVLNSLVANHRPIVLPAALESYVENEGHLLKTRIRGESFTFLACQANEIHISKTTQTQFPSIKAALLANASKTNLVFHVYPGEYAEENPLVLPQGCVLNSIGTPQNTVIKALVPHEKIVVMGRGTMVQGLGIVGKQGNTGVSFDGCQSNGLGEYSSVSECFITDCAIGIQTDGCNMPLPGITDTLFCEKIVVRPKTQMGLKAFAVLNGGCLITIGCQIIGIPPCEPYPNGLPYAYGVHCTGLRSKAAMYITSNWFNETGCFVDDRAVLTLATMTVNYCRIGVTIGPLGMTSTLEGSAVNTKGSFLYDIDVQAVDGFVDFQSGSFDETKIHNPNRVKLNVRYNTEFAGRTAQKYIGEIGFGSVDEATKVAIGEGMYANHVVVLSNTYLDEGQWNDHSLAAETIYEHDFPLFGATATGACCYVGSPNFIFGVKLRITDAVHDPQFGREDTRWEYWNGTSWKYIHVMQTEASYPCYSVSQSVFTKINKYQLRFGLSTATPFAKRILHGRNLYWVRCRLRKDIANIPRAEYLKVHANSSLVNSDGWIEYFGMSRPIKNMLSNLEISYPSNGVVPEQEVFLTKDLSFSRPKNLFRGGVKTRIGLRCMLPLDMDTSFYLKILFSGVAANSSQPGNVSWTMRYALMAAGDSLYFEQTVAPENSANLTCKTKILTTPILAPNKEIRQEVAIDLSRASINPPDGSSSLLWITFERDATPANLLDTYPGDFAILLFKSKYVVWNHGAHLSSF